MLSLRYQKCLGIIIKNYLKLTKLKILFYVAHNKTEKVQESKTERKKEENRILKVIIYKCVRNFL